MAKMEAAGEVGPAWRGISYFFADSLRRSASFLLEES